LQDGSGSAEDQPHGAEHPSCSGEDPSRHETEFAKDLHEVPRRRWTRKSQYVAPPPSLQIQSIDRLLNLSVRGNHFLYCDSIMFIHGNTNYCTHLSCSSWEDTTFWGTCHQRQVNAVLGNLVHMHYPGEVTLSIGTTSPATCWDDYTVAPDMTYVTAKGAMWSDFWVSFSKFLLGMWAGGLALKPPLPRRHHTHWAL
jgi:hypothetical protein